MIDVPLTVSDLKGKKAELRLSYLLFWQKCHKAWPEPADPDPGEVVNAIAEAKLEIKRRKKR